MLIFLPFSPFQFLFHSHSLSPLALTAFRFDHFMSIAMSVNVLGANRKMGRKKKIFISLTIDAERSAAKDRFTAGSLSTLPESIVVVIHFNWIFNTKIFLSFYFSALCFHCRSPVSDVSIRLVKFIASSTSVRSLASMHNSICLRIFQHTVCK